MGLKSKDFLLGRLVFLLLVFLQKRNLEGCFEKCISVYKQKNGRFCGPKKIKKYFSNKGTE